MSYTYIATIQGVDTNGGNTAIGTRNFVCGFINGGPSNAGDKVLYAFKESNNADVTSSFAPYTCQGSYVLQRASENLSGETVHITLLTQDKHHHETHYYSNWFVPGTESANDILGMGTPVPGVKFGGDAV